MSKGSISPVTSHVFCDPEALVASAPRQQNLSAIQLDLHPLRCQILHLQLDGAEFVFRDIRNPLRVLGDKNPDVLTFEFLMSSPSVELISHGSPIQANTLYGFDNRRGIDMVLPANAQMGTLLIRQEIVEEYLQVMERTDLNERFFATNKVQNATHFVPVLHYLQELRGLVQERSPFLNQPQISRVILEDYLPLLIEAIPPMEAQGSKPARSRVKLVQQAEDYMRAHLDEPMTLKDLCQILNTSSSPLNYGFQEVFGLSPMAYLKRLRLHAAHKTLKTSDPTITTVQDIAHHFGFWHTGRFSQEYRQLFGELPSAALKT
jgi:AraC family ethanolamine operon transcriptional activator